jgi:DNA polymerase-1
VLLAADYSQIELRVIAEISRDEGLGQAFIDGADIHRSTAARVYGVSMDAVTDDMRRKAKMVNFGIPYGITAFGLSQRLNCPRREAADLIDEYFQQYPKVKAYMNDTIAFAREHEYVATLLGRRRYLRDINSRNGTVRSATERNAINMPIQGTSADMIKIAMINLHRELSEQSLATRLLLQVHDELVLEVPHAEIAPVKRLVDRCMREAIPMEVPIVVEIGTGSNWLEAH